MNRLKELKTHPTEAPTINQSQSLKTSECPQVGNRWVEGVVSFRMVGTLTEKACLLSSADDTRGDLPTVQSSRAETVRNRQSSKPSLTLAAAHSCTNNAFLLKPNKASLKTSFSKLHF